MNTLIEDISNKIEDNKQEELLNFFLESIKNISDKEKNELIESKTSDGWSLIQLATYYKNNDILEWYLQNSTYDQINNLKKHPIFIALEEKNNELIDTFLKHYEKINFNYVNDKNEKFLYYAIKNKQYEFAKFLINNNESIYDINGFSENYNNTPFNLLITNKEYNFFKENNLEEKLNQNYNEIYLKSSIKNQSHDFFDTLIKHTKLSNDEIFQLCVDFNNVYAMNSLINNVDFLPGEKQIKQIIKLISNNFIEEKEIKAAIDLTDYLVAIKIPFSNFQDEEGKNIWMLCIENNNVNLFDKIYEINSNLNIPDSEGHTPLFYAIKNQNLDFLNKLLKNGANTGFEDKLGTTPIIKAVEIGNLDILNSLLEYHNNINQVNKSGNNALSLAINRKRMDLVSALIWAGGEINVNPVEFVEEKHLWQIGYAGNTEKFSYHDQVTIDNFVALSQIGFNLNQKNKDGDTFLLHFIKNSYLGNFKALMKCNVNQNAVDVDGNNALMLAVKKTNPDYFISILSKFNKLDFKHKNNEGQNIYDLCSKTLSAKKSQALILEDSTCTLEDVNKLIPTIIKNGRLAKVYDKLVELKFDFENYKDSNNNSLLMLSIAGGNDKNFKFLLEEVKIKPSTKDVNINNKNYKDLLLFLPEELQIEFFESLKNYVNQPKKK